MCFLSFGGKLGRREAMRDDSVKLDHAIGDQPDDA
jgi:hypothetical protein